MTLSLYNTPLPNPPKFPNGLGPDPRRGPILVQENAPPPKVISRPNEQQNNKPKQ